MVASSLSAYLAASPRRRAQVREAVWWLLVSAILKLAPASFYTRRLGRLNGPPPTPVSSRDVEMAIEIGRIIERTARNLPFRPRCLVQAMAARRMLERRAIPATVRLGLAARPGERPNEARAAHAWVEVGDRIVCGEAGHERFVVVGTFT